MTANWPCRPPGADPVAQDDPKTAASTGVTGVTVPLTAKHLDALMSEGLHGHTWTVTAFWPAEPLRDGRCLKAMLSTVLEALPDAEGVLPPELWAAEDIARTVARLLCGCVGVRITRPEGFEAWVWL